MGETGHTGGRPISFRADSGKLRQRLIYIVTAAVAMQGVSWLVDRSGIAHTFLDLLSLTLALFAAVVFVWTATRCRRVTPVVLLASILLLTVQFAHVAEDTGRIGSFDDPVLYGISYRLLIEAMNTAGIVLLLFGLFTTGIRLLRAKEELDERSERLRRQVVEREHEENVLRALVEGAFTATGAAFFPSLARHLAQMLGVKYVYVLECVEPDRHRGRTLASWVDGAPGPDLVFDLAGTPCESVVRGERAFYADRVREQFPHDSYLAELGARSYLGVPMRSAAGPVVGHVAVLDTAPMRDDPFREWIVGVFAERAAAELERARAEAALEASERTLRSVFDNVPDFVLLTDLAGKVRLINRTSRGLNTKRLLGTRIVDYVTEAHRPLLEQVMRTVVETGLPQSYEVEGQTEDGGTGWYACRMGPIISNGRITDLLVVATDVTARKRAEAESRAVRERYKILAENVRDIIWEIDPSGRFTYVSPSIEALAGVTPAELIGKHVTSVLKKPSAQLAQKLLERALRGEVEEQLFEVEHVTKNKGSFWGEISATVIRDESGGIVAIQGVTRDVTERRRAEETLRSIVKGTSGAVGQQFYRSLVRRLASALGVRCALLGRLTERDGPAIRTLAVWDTDRHAENFEYALIGTPCADVMRRGVCHYPTAVRESFPNDPLLVEMGIESYLGTPLRDSTGKVIGILVVMDSKPMHDVRIATSVLEIFATRAGAELERERAEEERQRIEAQMQHAQKLESLGVLAGGIAHDFNNLLAGIMGYANLAEEELPEGSPARDYLHQIGISTLRAAELTRQMLAYSGKGHFVIGPCNLSEIASEMVQLLKASITKKAVIEFDFDHDLPLIEGDGTQIRQVIMNLITNASDALEDQSGTIRLSTRRVRLDDHESAGGYLPDPIHAGEYACIEVSDTGVGMDQETLSKIFDPFFTTKFTGRGLGLAAVLGIVRGHGGAIRVESAPGAGATFRVYFPAAAPSMTAAAPALEAPAAPFAPAHNGGAVLVVDDEEVVRAITREVLEKAGFRVLTATNGQEGLAVFRRCADDITAVVLDLTMPYMSGVEALREIRKIRPGVPVLLSSGYTEEEAARKLDGHAPNGFIQKPYRASALLAKLQETLAR